MEKVVSLCFQNVVGVVRRTHTKEEVLTRDGPDNEVKGFLAALMTMDV
jgi:hypothetical protein